MSLVFTKTGGHYQIDGQNLRRVTRITGRVPKQDFLIPWSARITAEAASELAGAFQSKSVFIDEVKAESDRRRTVARNRGTEIHAAIEASFAGQRVQETYLPWVEHAYAALDNLGLRHQEHRTEITIANLEYGYAGTVDVIGDDWIADWKTGRIYTDHALQMWAYLMATHEVVDGRLVKIKEYRTEAYIIALKPDGYTYETISKNNTELMALLEETFVALQHVDGWCEIKEKAVYG